LSVIKPANTASKNSTTILNRVLNVPIELEKIEFRNPKGTGTITEIENKHKQVIKVLKEEIGEEKYQKLLTQMHMGYTEEAQEALKRMMEIARELNKKNEGLEKVIDELNNKAEESKEVKPPVEEYMTPEEKEEFKSMIDDLEGFDF